MTRQESIKLLALIKVAYPTAFKDMDKESKIATVNMWHSTFPDVPFVIMELALDHFRRVSKFPPTVAEMYEELKGLYCTAVMDANIASTEGDEETVKRCMWIIKHTSGFRSNEQSIQINYSAISNSMLIALPEGEGREKYEAL